MFHNVCVCVCLKIPVGDPEARRADGVPVALRVPPGRAVPAALPAGEDSMHAGGTRSSHRRGQVQ